LEQEAARDEDRMHGGIEARMVGSGIEWGLSMVTAHFGRLRNGGFMIAI
jgi:hypothetical protein